MQQENRKWNVRSPFLLISGIVLSLICSLLAVFISGDRLKLSQANIRSTELAQTVEATLAARYAQIPITAPTVPAGRLTPIVTLSPPQTPGPTYTAEIVNTPPDGRGSAGKESEAAYLTQIADLSVGCQKGLYGIAKQSEKASENSLIMFEAQWKIDLEAALLNIEEYCVGMREISPVPPRFTTLHGYVASMAEEMDEMVNDYRYGVDNLDAERLESASEHMRKGTEYVEMMGNEMERINNR